jgi:hypothetical protein
MPRPANPKLTGKKKRTVTSNKRALSQKLTKTQQPTKPTKPTKPRRKVCISLVNEQGHYNMYVIPGNHITDDELRWCQILHEDGKNQPKRMEVTRVNIGDLAQIRLNFMQASPSTATAIKRTEFLQSLYKKEHDHLYRDVGKWVSYVRIQPCNVFVLRNFCSGFAE